MPNKSNPKETYPVIMDALRREFVRTLIRTSAEEANRKPGKEPPLKIPGPLNPDASNQT